MLGYRNLPTVTTYFLETRTPTTSCPAPPRAGALIVRADKLTLKFYRYLYDAVGEPWQWIDRKDLSDDELAALVLAPGIEVHVLYVSGVPAGYIELDRRIAGEVKLAYLGLLPEFIGQGLGKYILEFALYQAFVSKPARVWVHTCTLDHPGALKNYLSAGFVEYDRHTE